MSSELRGTRRVIKEYPNFLFQVGQQGHVEGATCRIRCRGPNSDGPSREGAALADGVHILG